MAAAWVSFGGATGGAATITGSFFAGGTSSIT
jgi:hypothetical protein